MKTIASAAVSLDGYMDDNTPRRLVLSTPEDWEQVYALRASCDAILVGAGTLRADNPSLSVKGRGPDPLRVTMSRQGDLDPSLKFFTGPGRAMVFTAPGGGEALRRAFASDSRAEVVPLPELTPAAVVAELARRGVRRLMVEGGAQTLNAFFEANLVDELRLAVAPFFVGEAAGGPHFAGTGRMILQRIDRTGDMAVIYCESSDAHYLREAIAESRKCTPSATAYSVGAVIVTAAGGRFYGYTHETGPANHAEEEAIAKALAAGASLRGATMYSSMEPCSVRHSKPVSCSQLIIEHRFARSVFAYAEPLNFVDGRGEETLRAAGVAVRVLDWLAPEVIEINSHILK